MSATPTVVPLRPRARPQGLVPPAPRVIAAFSTALLRAPPKPSGLTACVAWLQESAESLPPRQMAMRALQNLRKSLFAAPGRDAEMALLWREAVATACFARIIATHVGMDAPLLTGAALLHRTGEITALRALSQAEQETGQRLLGPVMQQILEARDDDLVARVTRVWSLTGELRLLITRWRDEQEQTARSPEVNMLTMAQAFATELVHAETCTPGLVTAACEALHLPPALVQEAQAATAGINSLLTQVAPLPRT